MPSSLVVAAGGYSAINSVVFHSSLKVGITADLSKLSANRIDEMNANRPICSLESPGRLQDRLDPRNFKVELFFMRVGRTSKHLLLTEA